MQNKYDLLDSRTKKAVDVLIEKLSCFDEYDDDPNGIYSFLQILSDDLDDLELVLSDLLSQHLEKQYDYNYFEVNELMDELEDLYLNMSKNKFNSRKANKLLDSFYNKTKALCLSTFDDYYPWGMRRSIQTLWQIYYNTNIKGIEAENFYSKLFDILCKY